MRIELFGFLLHKEKAGQISEGPCWCLWHGCYLYTGDNLFQLLRVAIKYWKDERMMVG